MSQVPHLSYGLDNLLNAYTSGVEPATNHRQWYSQQGLPPRPYAAGPTNGSIRYITSELDDNVAAVYDTVSPDTHSFRSQVSIFFTTIPYFCGVLVVFELRCEASLSAFITKLRLVYIYERLTRDALSLYRLSETLGLLVESLRRRCSVLRRHLHIWTEGHGWVTIWK